ncbi:MAG TPA: hypothetical protein VKZ50_19300 [bacterium]|nr:hypothetical protein [bacterium]
MRTRSVVHLAALGVFLAGLLASAGSERSPYHAHIVIGGTLAERARVLAAHLQEEAGSDTTPIFGELAPARAPRGGTIRVFSVLPRDGGAALWSSGGALHVTAYAAIRLWPPHRGAGLSATRLDGTPQVARSAAEPPPRSV